MGLVSTSLVILMLTWIAHFIIQKLRIILKQIGALQGPPALPLIGNLHQLHLKPDEFFEQAQGLAYMLQARGERMCRIWMGPWPWVLLYGAEECEAILGSNKILDKPLQYGFLSGWIGQGLLVSEPKKWRLRRRLLTPTFHYDILKDFVDVYNKHGQTLMRKFQALCGDQYNDIFHMISLCTLDVICEAALGIHVDAQKKSSPYLDAVFKIKYMIHQRTLKAHFYSDIIYNIFGSGKEEKKCIEILHEFTGTAVANRKRLVNEAGGVDKLMEKEKVSGKRRMAFLDFMLDLHAKGELSMEEIQAKVQKEIDEVLGEENRSITYEDLRQLKFLEACIKETLRLFPSVPIQARQLTKATKIVNKVLPSGTGVAIIASMIHRDVRYWPDPEIFKPERFLGNQSRHPFSYIPFSAGSRNCIGQRFALMEEKCILALLMRNLKVKSKLRTDQIRVSAELVIRPLLGNNMRFEPRKFGDYVQIA